jgi:hypothetical protein
MDTLNKSIQFRDGFKKTKVYSMQRETEEDQAVLIPKNRKKAKKSQKRLKINVANFSES